MRILIFADMEGLSGVDDVRMFSFAFPEAVETACQLMTADVNAAIRGLRRAGAEAIDIFDGHGMGGNVIENQLEEGATYLGGGWMTKLVEMIRIEAFKSYDALILLGQHAAEGTLHGFMSHTNTGHSALRINGKFVGEAPQIAWLAGHFSVPTLMIAGDDAVIREAKALLPGIEGVIIKTSTSRTQTESLPVEEAHTLIEEAAYKTSRNFREFRPFELTIPIKVEIIFAEEEIARSLARLPGYTQLDDKIVSFTAKDYVEAFFAYHACRTVVSLHLLDEALNKVKELDAAKNLLQEWQQLRWRKFFKDTGRFPVVKY